jgi:hypothetical protein
MRRGTLLWTALAVCGVLLVAGVTLAASTLSTQTIGLSSEPPSAGDELSPSPTATPQAARRTPPARRERRPRPRTTDRRPSATATATATAPPATDDDNSGSDGDNSGPGSDGDSSGQGRGRGRGRGGDDD